MKSVIARFAIAALAVAMTLAGAEAQNAGGGGHKRQQESADKTAAKSPKADEKAYRAALESLPNKQYDPWHSVR
jgi:hypothetical protein